MLINLYDANFQNQPTSVWNQTSKHIEYVRGLPAHKGVTIFTDAFVLSDMVDEVHSAVKVGWLREPQCLWPLNYAKAVRVMDKFDFILTYHQPLIERDPRKFRFCPYGGSWIPLDRWGVKPKTKPISMLIGSKKSAEGHLMRHAVYDALQAAGLGDQVDFYGVYGQQTDYSWQTKYRVHADYAYSIVCETCREDNLFTELLLDCFAVGTIPIFWGLPNHERFFGEGSIPHAFVDAHGAVEQVRSVAFGDADLYEKRLDMVYMCMEDAVEYAVTEDWLYWNVLREYE